ncbi:MAG: SGNH/GDSL hydrolase family protein [Candidatus Bathyarchaeia archaeon]
MRFLQIVLFGDSLSWSWRAPYGKRYADFIETEIQRHIDDCIVDVAACGNGGDTAELGLQRVERDCIEYSPHVVVMNFGVNDPFKTSKAKFENAYQALIETILKKTKAFLILETIPFLDEKRFRQYPPPQQAFCGGLESYLERFSHSFIREMANKYSLLLHDRFEIFHREFGKTPSLSERLIRDDGVHLTIEGNKFFASTLAEMIITLASKIQFSSDDAALWLEKAKQNPIYRECCVMLENGRLEQALLSTVTQGKENLPKRLMLQQCRSFARRAYALATDGETEYEALLTERLAAGFLAAERALNPFCEEALTGSVEWATQKLYDVRSELLAQKLIDYLQEIKEPSLAKK